MYNIEVKLLLWGFFMKRTTSLPDALFGILTTVLLGVKSGIFYSHLNLAGYTVPLTLATMAIHFLVYVLLMALHPKAARIVSMTLYTFGSLFMAIDLVYFSYVSKLPSAVLLKILWQMEKISDTVENLIHPIHMLLMCDLPLFVLWSVNRDLIEKKFGRLAEWLKKRIVPRMGMILSGTGCAALTAIVLILWPGFRAEYMANEMITYHMTDFYTTFTGLNRERQVDKSLYTEPDFSTSEYWGIAQGRNLIVIQVEALQNFVIGQSYHGQELTPVLNSLIAGDTFYFDNYYYQIGGGNTADAEFHVNNSLFAPENAAAYIQYAGNTYHGLPYLLKDNGYSGAHAFHNYIASFWSRETAYPVQGFDSYTSVEDFEMTDPFPMGLSDTEMFRQSMDQLVSWKEPFYAFYVTVSSHHPYTIPEKDRGISLAAEDEGTMFGSYLQAVNYADRAIGEFIAMLEEAGLYENSVIVIYGDHYALTNTDHAISSQVLDLTGELYTIYDVFNVPMLIHIPGMDRTETVSTAGGHMDVMPTLLPLLGIRNDKTVMFGQNLLEAETGFVCQQTHVSVGSFISDEVFFSKPHNNILENYDAYQYGTMKQLDPTRFTDQSEDAERRIRDCEALLEADDIYLE